MKSLDIKLKQGNEHDAASTYHQLGIIAREQQDFAAAEGWHMKSLDINLKQDNEHGAALTYYQQGELAAMQQDFTTAEYLYNKALATFQRYNDEYRIDMVKHNLSLLNPN